MQKIIDPHLHLFALEQGDYTWLKPANAPHWPNKQQIHRSFGEANLQLLPAQSLEGFVHIEAGFDNQEPWREIAWLEQECTLPFRSIAGADLLDPQFGLHLQVLSDYHSAVGVRHILEEDADAVLSQPAAKDSLQLLAQQGWIFEAQLFLHDLPAVHKLVDIAVDLPQLTLVINHAGFPLQATHQSDWLTGLTLLSALPKCAIKFSGWEMHSWQWPREKQALYLAQILEVMGTSRVMMASNFPVSALCLDYAQLWRENWQLAESHQLAQTLCCDNAKNWYGIPQQG